MLILTWDEHVCGVHLGLIFGGGLLPVEVQPLISVKKDMA